MALNHLQTLMTPLILLLILQLTQPSQSLITRNLNPSRDFLVAHNQARAAVKVAPLKWSPALANATSKLVETQKAKHNCQFANLSSDRTIYGANQLWTKGTVYTPQMVVNAWVGEKKYYNYGTGSCVANHHCGVYTQVVWRKSLELGCAQATCAKDGSTLTVCFYNPPGNVVGEKPY